MIELLVSLVVVALLAVIALALTGRTGDEARRTRGLGDLKQIGVAIHLYAQDRQGGIPPFNGNPQKFKQGIGTPSNSTGNSASFAELLIPDYLPNPEVFLAPADTFRRAHRDRTTGWASQPNAARAEWHSYVYVYMNPSTGVQRAERALPLAEGGMGYGELWNVRYNAPQKVVAFSVYADNNWPVYKDGTMILRLGGSVEWYANGSFRRDRSSIGQFGVRAE